MATYGFDALGQIWENNGGNPSYRAVAAAVALAESGGRTDAISSTHDYGLWQINIDAHPKYDRNSLLEANYNALAAIQVSGNGTNWKPWCTAWTDNACGSRGGRFWAPGARAYDIWKSGGGYVGGTATVPGTYAGGSFRQWVHDWIYSQSWLPGVIKDGLWSIASTIIDWIAGGFDKLSGLLDWLSRWKDWLFGQVEALWQAIWDRIQEVWHWVQESVIPWVQSLWSDLRDWTVGAVNWLTDHVHDLWDSLFAWVKDMFGWLEQNVWQPIWSSLRGVWDWVRDSVIPWVKGLWDDLRGWVGGLWDWIDREIHKVIDWLYTWGNRWVDFWEIVGRNLVDFAVDPIGWLSKHLEQIIDHSADWWKQQVAKAITQDADVVGAFLTHWLAS